LKIRHNLQDSVLHITGDSTAFLLYYKPVIFSLTVIRIGIKIIEFT